MPHSRVSAGSSGSIYRGRVARTNVRHERAAERATENLKAEGAFMTESARLTAEAANSLRLASASDDIIMSALLRAHEIGLVMASGHIGAR
jgi:hypothetical protein